MILLVIGNFSWCIMDVFDVVTFQIEQIALIIFTLQTLVMVHVFTIFVKQWMINYIQDERLKQDRLRILFIIQLVFSIVFIIVCGIRISFAGYSSPMYFVYKSMYYALVVLIAIAGIVIVKQMQRLLRNIQPTEDNVEDIRSSHKTIRILVLGLVVVIVWGLSYFVYLLGVFYLTWSYHNWVMAVCRGVGYLLCVLICVLLGFKSVKNENARSMCRNCIKTGLIGDGENDGLLRRDSTSMIQMNGK